MQLSAGAGEQLSCSLKAAEGASRCRDLFELWESNPLPVEKEKGARKVLSKITTRMKRHVRHVLKDENPTIWVGKDGFTPEVAGEVEKQLQKNKMVKARILPSAIQGDVTAKAIAAKAAEQTDSALVEIRGHVFILYRRRRKPES
jgi:putative YhbY family RNA-binding protein